MRTLSISFLFFILLSTTIHAASWERIVLKDRHHLQVEIVTSVQEQRMGLGNRDSLETGKGMLFLYQRAGEHIFWMKRMRFAIDIIWLLGGKVVHIEKNVPPPSIMAKDRQLARYGSRVISDMVLEVPAHYSEKIGLTPGDPLRFTTQMKKDK